MCRIRSWKLFLFQTYIYVATNLTSANVNWNHRSKKVVNSLSSIFFNIVVKEIFSEWHSIYILLHLSSVSTSALTTKTNFAISDIFLNVCSRLKDRKTMLNISLATGRGTISQNHECWGVFLQCKIADNDCYISSLFWPITLPSTCWFFPHRKETAGSLQRWSIGKKWAVQRFSWHMFCKFRFVFQCLSFVSWHLYCMYFVFVLYLSTYIVCAGKKWASTVVLLQPPFCTTNDIRPHVHSFLISYGNQFSPDSSGNTYRNIAEVEYDCLKTKAGSDFLWYRCWKISFLWKQGPYNCWVELWYDGMIYICPQ